MNCASLNSADASAKTQLTCDIALVTEQRYIASTADASDWYLDNILRDDRSLIAALGARGLSACRVDWSDPAVDWAQFRCAVFRTTWDYFHRFAEFSRWLDYVETQTQLWNELAIVRWNLDKHYLGDLARQGVRTVPTQFLQRDQCVPLARLLDQWDWDEAVIKPCVSGAARHTYRVRRETADEVAALVNPVWRDEAMLIQPFQHSVVERGEASLMLFDGQFSHAVLKRAKPGDFRVQDDHGGTVVDYEPTAAEVRVAEQAITACPAHPIYARVDLVQDNSGEFAVSELELIEPELWLRRHAPSAEYFAAALASRLQLMASSRPEVPPRIR